MKKRLGIYCKECGKKAVKAFRYGWFGIREKGLHCPHCKKFYRLNEQGESLVMVIIELCFLGFIAIAVALIVVALTGCTPY